MGVVIVRPSKWSWMSIGDNPAMGLAELIELLARLLHAGAGGHGERDRIEPGQCRRSRGIVAQGKLHGPARVAQRKTHDDLVLDELDDDGETEDTFVPVAASGAAFPSQPSTQSSLADKP